jgi:carbamoyl-phosphate synthase large subunit
VRSLETGKKAGSEVLDPRRMTQKLVTPQPERLSYIRFAFREGHSVREVARLTSMDPWFLYQIKEISDTARRPSLTTLGKCHRNSYEKPSASASPTSASPEAWSLAGNDGVEQVRMLRRQGHGLRPVFKLVDTCAAEFESFTPYLYSSYDEEDEAPPTSRRKVIILGSGPNRIGQGIEFDYCCCHAAFALREDGYETIMVNCNPETVSTDYDTSDRLYFEPLTLEDVLAVYEHEASGGAEDRHDRPVRRANAAQPRPPPQSRRRSHHRHLAGIHRPRRRSQAFGKLLEDLQNSAAARRHRHQCRRSARVGAERIGYPVLVRPSYVLGGRAMVIAFDAEASPAT